ncbi:MAG: SMC family ATPase, partial [Desulfurivibrionaceae bacterium]|nr:SMC family ATPase [Desulfurivibrionaceae bacterium]
TLKNIKSHQDLELPFVSGINVLAGVNGVGKSTIFEAIGYALFGVDARDFVGNIERFISIGAKKGEVTVTFSPAAGDIYRVSRSVGAGSKWLLARETGGAFEVEEHAGAPETEARIKELLGLDGGRALADQFKLVIGPFQHDFLGPFVLRQPAKRQEAFDAILGIDAWRKTYKGTTTLLKAVKSRMDLLKVEIQAKEEQVAALPERQKEVRALAEEAAAQQKLVGEKEKGLAAIQGLLVLCDGQEKKIQTLKGDILVLENRMKDGEGKIVDNGKRVKEAELALETMEKSRPGQEAFAAAEAELKTLREQERQRRALEKEISALDRETARLAQALAHERQEIKKTATELAAEEERLCKEEKEVLPAEGIILAAARLPALKTEAERLRQAQGLLEGRRVGLLEGREKLAEGVCPFFQEACRNIAGKVPGDLFSARLDHLDQEGKTLAQRLAETERQRGAAEKAGQELAGLTVRGQELAKQRLALAERSRHNSKRQEALAGVEKEEAAARHKATLSQEELRKYSHLDQEIAALEKKRLGHQAARDAFFANQKEALDLQKRRDSLAAMVALLEELRTTLTARGQELAALSKEYDAKGHAQLRLDKEALVGALATGRQKIADLGRERLRLDGEIKKMVQIKAEIKALLAAGKGLSHKEGLVKFLRTQIFNNVSAKLSERFREEISLRADRIYRTIAETDEELSWGDKYQIILRDMEDGRLRERSDEQLSGGQTMSAVVALRLALLQTIGARVAFFDEPTSNLDAARRANLAQAFRAIDVGREEVTEHWYDQLFLISHDVAFTEVTDQIICLE